ncbi:LysM peptidoglycan-binding domain-containing protein [Deltaproteobacteria bacterium OttesenSCG-928-K17]|nr:LysM peptidoglycan-binding domain-containing protein [Deltaproteobacteria bacterium OttesenSCG-928-K17]
MKAKKHLFEMVKGLLSPAPAAPVKAEAICGGLPRWGVVIPGVALAVLTMLPGGQLNAQEQAGQIGTLPLQTLPASGESGRLAADRSITMTKVLEVYEIDGLKYTVDQYQLKKGDSLIKILQARGLVKNKNDQAGMIRLVRELNPDLKSLDALNVGQVLNLPSIVTPEQLAGLEAAAAAENAPAAPEIPSGPVMVTETVKEYQRTAPSQQPVQVKILRHREDVPPPPQATAEPPAEPQLAELPTLPPETAPPQPAEPTAHEYHRPISGQQPTVVVSSVQPGQSEVLSGVRGTTTEVRTAGVPQPQQPVTPQPQPQPQQQQQPQPQPQPGAQAAAPAAAVDYPSGNAGPVAMEPASRVVYRTVKVRRGDTLERLLRREGMHRDLIYGHLLKVTMELNPELRSPDLIMAGAEIRIPAAGDYLTAMAGVDPGAVKTAAQAVHERRRPAGGGAGAGSVAVAKAAPSGKASVLALPTETTESAKNTLSLLFTRLGERVDSRGQALLPSDGGGAVEINTTDFPVVSLQNGGRLVLDPGSRLSSGAVRSLRALSPPLQVFRTSRKENLDQALGRLWPLCGYYRVYNRERAYEGGADIRLKISADWMVWPTEESWKAGQPMVINRIRTAGKRSDAAWVSFLEDHGIKLVDISKNTVLPPQESTPPPALNVVALNSNNPSILAAELVKNLGVDPKVGVQLDLVNPSGGPTPPNLTAPVMWETGKDKVVLEFGEMPADALAALRQNGYKVVSSTKDTEAVIEGVLKGYGLKAQDSLKLTAPAGGPAMSLTIKGRVVTSAGRKFLITPTALPSGLARLIEPSMVVLKY